MIRRVSGRGSFRIAHNEAYSLFRKRKPEVDIEDLPEPVSANSGGRVSV